MDKTPTWTLWPTLRQNRLKDDICILLAKSPPKTAPSGRWRDVFLAARLCDDYGWWWPHLHEGEPWLPSSPLVSAITELEREGRVKRSGWDIQSLEVDR